MEKECLAEDLRLSEQVNSCARVLDSELFYAFL